MQTNGLRVSYNLDIPPVAFKRKDQFQIMSNWLNVEDDNDILSEMQLNDIYDLSVNDFQVSLAQIPMTSY